MALSSMDLKMDSVILNDKDTHALELLSVLPNFALQTCPTDLQTKADRLAQMSICSSLARKFPKLTIIGEEVRLAKEARFCQ